jgi:hypothetical protein
MLVTNIFVYLFVHYRMKQKKEVLTMADKEYIERNALIAEYDRVHIGAPGGARKLMVDAPAADVVSRSVFEQVKWERDIAMEQLNDHKIPFGCIAPDVVEVVRCKNCVNYEQNPWNKEEMICRCFADWHYPEPDDFCSYGERKE